MIHCKQEECIAQTEDDKTRAIDAGWYFSLNGDAYCPNHPPAYLSMWRKGAGNSGTH